MAKTNQINPCTTNIKGAKCIQNYKILDYFISLYDNFSKENEIIQNICNQSQLGSWSIYKRKIFLCFEKTFLLFNRSIESMNFFSHLYSNDTKKQQKIFFSRQKFHQYKDWLQINESIFIWDSTIQFEFNFIIEKIFWIDHNL